MNADLLFELARLFAHEAQAADRKEAMHLFDTSDEIYELARHASRADEAA